MSSKLSSKILILFFWTPINLFLYLISNSISPDTFDLSIADEAHRCTGKVDSNFALILNDNKIRSKKKLFTTATPKIYSNYIKEKAKSKKIDVIDMDDKSKFGEIFFNNSFWYVMSIISFG